VRASAAAAPAAPPELDGKRVVITGASRGIGAACAIACAKAGAEHVSLIARTRQPLKTVAREIHRVGGRASVHCFDVTDMRELTAGIRATGELDVLVNCAGANQPEPLLDVSAETFERLWRLNVQAVFFASQTVAQKMIIQGRGGVIVNVSSQMGHVGAALRTVYCTTKHAVEGLTKAMAAELGEAGIRVVSVAPTFTETAMTARQLADPRIRARLLGQIPLGRFGNVEDTATAVVFAASDRARMFTGRSLIIDGGWTAQ
jgi:NAD(P)-dependent dehydrogenase (short-subunit alcohol dehydrogenase family)